MRDFPWEDIFEISASAAASERCDWLQVGIYVYIPHRKYEVRPHSSPWFSAPSPVAIVYRNHFFHLHQQNKSAETKEKFKRLVIVAKRFLNLPNMHMLIKQKSP